MGGRFMKFLSFIKVSHTAVVLVSSLSIVIGITCTEVYASPRKDDSHEGQRQPSGDHHKGIDELKDTLDEIKESIINIEVNIGDLQENVGQIKNSINELKSAQYIPVDVAAQVDSEHCKTVPVQCSDPILGHTVLEGAEHGNHNPVALAVQVLDGGQPVTGLELTNFSLKSHLTPAGGTFPGLLDCASLSFPSSCFLGTSTGYYIMHIDPYFNSLLPGGPSEWLWKSGTYVFQLKVEYTEEDPDNGIIQRSGYALFRVDIPFVP